MKNPRANEPVSAYGALYEQPEASFGARMKERLLGRLGLRSHVQELQEGRIEDSLKDQIKGFAATMDEAIKAKVHEKNKPAWATFKGPFHSRSDMNVSVCYSTSQQEREIVIDTSPKLVPADSRENDGWTIFDGAQSVKSANDRPFGRTVIRKLDDDGWGVPDLGVDMDGRGEFMPLEKLSMREKSNLHNMLEWCSQTAARAEVIVTTDRPPYGEVSRAA